MRIAALSLLAFAAAAPCQTFFPPPASPAANPPSPDKQLLGMALFWDEQMSSTNTVACGSCHGFTHGGGDPRTFGTVHPGIDGVFGTADDTRGSRGVSRRDARGHYQPSAWGFGAQVTRRKSPSVVNAAYLSQLFWDGRVAATQFRDPVTNQITAFGPTALENLVLQPPLDPTEMGHPGRTWDDVIRKLERVRPLALASDLPTRLQTFVGESGYPELFERAFGSPGVTATRVAFAIADYLRTLVADETRFDLALAGQTTLTSEEALGRQLFESPSNGAASCITCHGDLSLRSHQSGPATAQPVYYGPGNATFHNIGLRPVEQDQGRAAITNQPVDQGRFRVPLLRNVALHSTFGHAGSIRSLEEMVEFYDRGGDYHVNQAAQIRPRAMTAAEKAALVAFLHTLTDPRVAAEQAPFDRPRLGSETGASMPPVFGTATAGTGGRQPRMLAYDPPTVGSDRITIGVADGLPGGFAFVMWDTYALRQGIANFGPTIYLHLVDFTLTGAGLLAAGPEGGHGSLTFSLPGNVALRGAELYAQWLILDPAGPNGASASPAAQLVIR